MAVSMQFRNVVKAVISGRPVSRVATDAGLPRDAIRNILEGHDPRLSRVEDVTRALDLEFYIGPPRGEDAADIAEPSEATPTAIPASSAEATPQDTIAAVSEAMSQQLATILRSEAETIRQEVCEGISQHLHSLQDETISRLGHHRPTTSKTPARWSCTTIGDGATVRWSLPDTPPIGSDDRDGSRRRRRRLQPR